jgi:hydroxymethylglutaryl-CoA lyase
MNVAVNDSVTIVDVGLRDGLQNIGPFVPTAAKIQLAEGLYAAGIRRIEIGSFVSASAVPQLSDTADLLKALNWMDPFDLQVLVPTVRRVQQALDAGARHLCFVVSVSTAHNQANVNRTPGESVAEFERSLSLLSSGIRLRLNIATAFDCPFEGRIPELAALALIEKLVALSADLELCLCDTTGKATPDHVSRLFAQCRARFPQVRAWAFHGHDTYGLGLANVAAAHGQGIRTIDAAFAGLGGCPFAPGATGNVATEDVVWMFERMGVPTHVDLKRLLPVTCEGAALPGATPGGRVRIALTAAGKLNEAKCQPTVA